MRFIREHKLFSLLITVVLILSITMIISYKTGGRHGFFGDMLQTGTTTIQKPLSNGSTSVKNNVRSIFKFKQVAAENEELKNEVNELQQQVIKLTLKKNELRQLQELSNALNYESVNDSQNVVSANIISLDGSNWFNLFTIDRGSESGIKKDCIVVNGDGLVGKITETGKGWSKVASIIDESNSVSFMVLRDMSLIGIVSGDSQGSLSGFMLDNKASVMEGDSLVTSNMGLYPAGIKIGKIRSVEYNSDTQLKTVKIEPSVSFKSLQKVAVII
ncbi:rod shape-determining protein MreC [Aminipila luticellarii]|uniref:Cell shape-determining protein MreC n=1 Tax=Aminipila luticellarii TaxID=2507160 RepID=A0A410PVY7_9FIRM|nr:rod shape-determining protein MreC [Aminipila luticellarii]QAT43060.1 rod shape-determining protein MreC [Aminipila luticellarii]